MARNLSKNRVHPQSVTRGTALAIGLTSVAIVGCSGANRNIEPSTSLSHHLASGGDSTSTAADTHSTRSQSSTINNSNTRQSSPSAIALVDGRPIDARKFVQTLVEARGLQLLQQMIFLEAVRAEAEKRNVAVTQTDIEREYDLTLKSVAQEGTEKDASLSEQQREALIDEWTRRNAVPRDELAIAMARQALLRELASADVRVTSDDVRTEVDRTQGERVVVRHLQLAAPRAYPRVQARLERGDSFEELVADYSINALTKADAGLLPPFTRDDTTVPRAFATVAFGLEPGQVSSLFESEGGYHVIKLERRIAADAGSLGDSRKQIERDLRERRITEKMQTLGREILEKAKIRIDESTLRRQYEDRKKRGLIEGPALAN